MSGLVTVGEPLGQVAADREGPLRPGAPAALSVCGAEATVAIGIRRLGIPAAYIGRVGDDAFGRMIIEALRGEGVDVSSVTVDPAAPTGLLLRTRRTADRDVVDYWRAGSAGSRLRPEDIDPEVVAAAGLLHVTGITPALSDTAAAAVGRACDLARRAGVPISFDVNHRSRSGATGRPGPPCSPWPRARTSSSAAVTSSHSCWTRRRTRRRRSSSQDWPPRECARSSSASAPRGRSASWTASSPGSPPTP